MEYHHTMPIQLRWMDADAFGHVNNAMYLEYYDTAKIEYFHQVCPEILEKYAIVAVHFEADFMHQVFTKDKVVNVETAITKIGHTSFHIRNRVVGVDDHEVKCEGETIMVLYDTHAEHTIPFTQEWREKIEKFEGRKLS